MSMNLSRRAFVGTSAAAAAAVAGLSLAGCGSKTEAPKTEAPKDVLTVRLGTTNDGHIFNAINLFKSLEYFYMISQFVCLFTNGICRFKN